MSKAQANRRVFLSSAAQLAAGCAAMGVCRPDVIQAAPERKTLARYDSYCGIFCGSCPSCVQSEFATNPAMVKCLGCKSVKTAPHCAKCEIKACAKQKGVEYCSMCKQYPCDQLKAFHNNGRDYRLLAADNLVQIRDQGVDKWLQQQKNRWVCPNCKMRFSFKDAACPRCRKPVYSAAQEAEALKKKQTGAASG